MITLLAIMGWFYCRNCRKWHEVKTLVASETCPDCGDRITIEAVDNKNWHVREEQAEPNTLLSGSISPKIAGSAAYASTMVPSTSIPTCPQCGNAILFYDDSNYCRKCGFRLQT